MSVDPIKVDKNRLFDPQQWNLYAYTRNNPMIHVDPDGRRLEIVVVNKTSYSDSVLMKAAEQSATKLRAAGVKNVSVKVVKDGLTNNLKSMTSKHVHAVTATDQEFPKNADGSRTRAENRGPEGGSITKMDAPGSASKDLSTGMANVISHEIGHDAGLKEETDQTTNQNNIMRDAIDEDWKNNPDLQFTDEQAKQLQEMYNEPGEVEESKPSQKEPPK